MVFSGKIGLEGIVELAKIVKPSGIVSPVGRFEVFGELGGFLCNPFKMDFQGLPLVLWISRQGMGVT